MGNAGQPVKSRHLEEGLRVNLNATAIATIEQFKEWPTTRHLVVHKYNKTRDLGWIVELTHPDHPDWIARGVNIDHLELA